MDHLTEFPSLHLPNAHVNFRVPGIYRKKRLRASCIGLFFCHFFVYLMDKFKEGKPKIKAKLCSTFPLNLFLSTYVPDPSLGSYCTCTIPSVWAMST